MLKQKNNRLKSLFYSSGETWWLIGFSMILAGSILTEPQILTAFLLKGDLSGMWLVWTMIIGSAFGKVFFAHLWHRLPVKTENELILFRFSGKGAKWLHIFRSIYVGGIVAPLSLSMAFLAFGRVLAEFTGISVRYAIIVILVYILIGTFFNSLRERLRFDFAYFIVFILSLVFIIFSLNKNLGTYADISRVIETSDVDFRLIPSINSGSFSAFLVFILVQWWSANIIDLPSMTGQKLMAAESQRTIVRSIILPQILFAVFFIAISSIPFFILLLDESILQVANGETAFVKIFTNSVQGPGKWVVLLFFLMPFTAITQNNQNWSGSLLVQNLYKYYLKPQASEKQLQQTGILVMIFVVVVAATIAIFNNSIVAIVKYIFTITAGVGPVFILRWYWHRINAWTQLSAMIASLIYPTIFDIAYTNIPTFTYVLDHAMSTLNVDYFPLKIVLLTIAVCTTWILIMYNTKPTEELTLAEYVKAVKPGGWWPFKNAGKVYFGKRLATALLLALGSILNFIVLWKFMSGHYVLAIILFVFSVIVLLLAYYLLKRINLQNG
jgi:Na+/proline symporter